jgi:hypothetical protein
MHRATIRVEGTDEALAWLQTVLDLTPHAQWSKGEPLLRGVRAASGFAATLAATENPQVLLATVRQFLLSCKERGVSFLDDTGLSAELVIAIWVGYEVRYSVALEFPRSDVLLIAEAGLRLTVLSCPETIQGNKGYPAASG